VSDGQPVVAVTLVYDHPGGLYGGVSAIAVATRHEGVEVEGYVADLGYAQRLTGGYSWEVGVSNSQISTFLDHRYAANYTEVYAGVAKGDVSARLYLSPNYLGENVRTLYIEVKGVKRLGDRWRLFAHAGLLTVVDGDAYPIGGPRHFDFQAGVARRFGPIEARLSGSFTTPRPVYPDGYPHPAAALVAGASVFF
jgi:hypothetical protein